MSKRVNISADTFAKRWKSGLDGAGAKIKDGINAVSTAPGQQAAEQRDVWLQRVTASADKWARNVASVSLQSWKDAAITKGIPALANATQLAQPKVKAAAEKLIPAINAALSDMPPRGATLDANLARVRHMASALQNAFA